MSVQRKFQIIIEKHNYFPFPNLVILVNITDSFGEDWGGRLGIYILVVKQRPLQGDPGSSSSKEFCVYTLAEVWELTEGS